jgi:predicted 3-demethylubiquinone-9 3-methyltransferase (glyoxalase superfamily)
VLLELLKDHESVKAQRAMEALLRMKKIDIAELERAVVTA